MKNKNPPGVQMTIVLHTIVAIVVMLILPCLSHADAVESPKQLTANAINVFPSQVGAMVVYSGDVLFNLSYGEMSNMSFSIQEESLFQIQVFQGDKHANVTVHEPIKSNKSIFVISKNRLGDLQVDLVQPNDTASNSTQLIFYNAITAYEFDLFALSPTTHEMHRLSEKVSVGHYSSTLVPSGDYEIKVFDRNSVNHADDFKNTASKTNTTEGKLQPKQFHLLLLYGDGKRLDKYPAQIKAIPSLIPSQTPPKPKSDLTIINGIAEDGQTRVFIDDYQSQPLAFGQTTETRVYMKKGHRIRMNHTGFKDAITKIIDVQVPYIQGKCLIVAELSGNTPAIVFNCWKNRNIGISNITSWIFMYNALHDCPNMELVALGNESSISCTKDCTRFYLLSENLSTGFGNEAQIPAGRYFLKSFPASTVTDILSFFAKAEVTNNVHVFIPGQIYFSAMTGRCGDRKNYNPQYIIHPRLDGGNAIVKPTSIEVTFSSLASPTSTAFAVLASYGVNGLLAVAAFVAQTI